MVQICSKNEMAHRQNFKRYGKYRKSVRFIRFILPSFSFIILYLVIILFILNISLQPGKVAEEMDDIHECKGEYS